MVLGHDAYLLMPVSTLRARPRSGFRDESKTRRDKPDHVPIWRHTRTRWARDADHESLSDDDKLHEECGVFGVSGSEGSAAALVSAGLHALQHRGQEAAGITSFDGAISIRTGRDGLSSAISTATR